MDVKNNKNRIAVLLAWIGLVIIAFIILVMAYGIMTKDGMLILASIFMLAFVSILYWIGIAVYKRIIKKDEEKYRDESRDEFINIAKTKTKNIK